ncbi:MAG: hypothetical protein K5871_07225 [Lachnospiraceae bacterium]|nr:hypothetical protein [Lachnospiraceae bacterium]
MAFASMFILFSLVIMAIMGLMLLTGLTLLIIGIITRVRDKTRKKAAPIVLIIIGSVIAGIPVLIVFTCFVSAIF